MCSYLVPICRPSYLIWQDPESCTKVTFLDSMTVVLFARRYVDSRVSVEETVWYQHEASIFGRHHGIVLNANIVREAETMPKG